MRRCALNLLGCHIVGRKSEVEQTRGRVAHRRTGSNAEQSRMQERYDHHMPVAGHERSG